MAQPAIVLISTVPNSVTLAEHRQLVETTPASFGDIPPVLRLKEDDVSIEFDPSVEGLSQEELSKGSLYIIESELAYVSSASGKGFKVLYPSITIHAVSRSGVTPHVYCQIEQQAGGTQEQDENIDVIELKIKPNNPAGLDNIFEQLSYCAALHPDPNTALNDEDDEAFYNGDFEPFNGSDGEELSEVGRVRNHPVNDNRYQPY